MLRRGHNLTKENHCQTLLATRTHMLTLKPIILMRRGHPAMVEFFKFSYALLKFFLGLIRVWLNCEGF